MAAAAGPLSQRLLVVWWGDRRAAQSNGNGNGRDGERKGQKWKAELPPGRKRREAGLLAFGGCRSGPGRLVWAFEHRFCQYFPFGFPFLFSRYLLLDLEPLFLK
jgi:hypothetical protein